MSARICPTTGAPCQAACSHLGGACNEPVPIALWIAACAGNAALMAQLLADVKSGKVVVS